MATNFTRRQFIEGLLLFSPLAAVPAGRREEAGNREVELCLLVFSSSLDQFLSAGPLSECQDDPAYRRYREKRQAEADFVRNLRPGDVLTVSMAPEDDVRESGIGDTGTSSLSKGGFYEGRQVDLFEAVTKEVALGTDMYAVVKSIYALPEPNCYRHIWFSLHAWENTENRRRLQAIASSAGARERARKYASDEEAYDLIWSLHDGTFNPGEWLARHSGATNGS